MDPGGPVWGLPRIAALIKEASEWGRFLAGARSQTELRSAAGVGADRRYPGRRGLLRRVAVLRGAVALWGEADTTAAASLPSSSDGTPCCPRGGPKGSTASAAERKGNLSGVEVIEEELHGGLEGSWLRPDLRLDLVNLSADRSPAAWSHGSCMGRAGGGGAGAAVEESAAAAEESAAAAEESAAAAEES
eukprot:CAMPEP_0181237854 /NCGR_PEP_ID=MMETSP1096-20121128/38999_1 /TAXON_ID=156174 ORGANISM="Chrysochromulina ericina, Strain CCMP281" /NCGR_SAMPLE_ID=MMETSP1096 /ASSEMBLY_ACC=CAM_ASM_000453 /LENGTH=189 /DNA_ID=CAMNT_0023333265 /DNA_START=798 /DNA_END=1363 /DNA_ORIENTATION=+